MTPSDFMLSLALGTYDSPVSLVWDDCDSLVLFWLNLSIETNWFVLGQGHGLGSNSTSHDF